MSCCGAKGFAATFGFKQSVDWRTAVVVAAGDGLEPTSESISQDASLIDSEALTGSRSRTAGDRGNELHAGDMAFEMKYEGLDVLLAMVLGTAAAPVQVGGDDAYEHDFTVNDGSLCGLMGTLVIDKQISVWEYPSSKVNSVTIAAAPNTLTTATFNFINSDLNRNTSVGTNNEATIASITIPLNRDFLLWEQLAIQANDQGDGALTTADLVYPSEFSITLTNNLVADDVTTRYGRFIDEPCPDGFLEVTGSINFSKYQEEKFVDWLFNKNLFKMDAIWTGPIADGAANFSFGIFMPSVQIASGDANIGGPGRVPANFEFTASKASALPTGMSNVQTAFKLINQRNTVALV